MSGDDIGRMIYLMLLLVVVGGYFFVSHRRNFSTMARQAALWGLIFVGVIAGYGLWGDIRSDFVSKQSVFEESGRIEVPRSVDGHYYLTVSVNGKPIRFVVDTGATDIVLTRSDAKRAGISENDLKFVGSASTANGVVRTAPVRLDSFAIGPIEDHRVRAWVNEGDLDTSLLGMTYLQRFETVSFSGGKLILQR